MDGRIVFWTEVDIFEALDFSKTVPRANKVEILLGMFVIDRVVAEEFVERWGKENE